MKMSSLFKSILSVSLVVSIQSRASSSVNIQDLASANPRSILKIQGMGVSTSVLKKIYSLNSFQSVWTEERINSFRQLAVNIESHGLRTSDYFSNRLDALSVDEREVFLTDALYRMASDLYSGRVQAYVTSPDVRFNRKEFQRFQELIDLLNSDPSEMEARMFAFAPQNQMYHSLLQMRSQLVNLKSQGELVPIPLKNKQVPQDMLTARLHLLGYDTTNLKEAILSFQKDHVISTDGEVGSGTLGLLNKSLSQRIGQIDINLERLRWLPEDLGLNYTFVNLANQKMHVMNLDQKEMEMNVVVGKELRKTPLLIDRVAKVILNPTWTAPRSIAVKDLLPKYIKDPSYFQTKHLRILKGGIEIFPSVEEMQKYKMHSFPYTIRQDAYPGNALGLVKFMIVAN